MQPNGVFILVLLGGPLVIFLLVPFLFWLRKSRRPLEVSRSIVLFERIHGETRFVQRAVDYVFSSLVSPTHGVTWSPDGKHIAATCRSEVQIRRVSSGKLIFRFLGHGASPQTIAWSPTGQFRLSSGDQGGTVLSWEWFPGEDACLSLGTRQSGPVSSLAWSPDGTALVSGGDATLNFHSPTWEAATRMVSRVQHDGAVSAVAWSPDGKYIASGGRNGSVFVREGLAASPYLSYQASGEAQVTHLAYSPSGQYLAAADTDGAIRIWEHLDGDFVATLSGFAPTLRIPQLTMQAHHGSVTAISWMADGPFLASGGIDGVIRVWDSATGKPCCQYAVNSPVLSMQWGPSGTASHLLALGCEGEPMQIIQFPHMF